MQNQELDTTTERANESTAKKATVKSKPFRQVAIRFDEEGDAEYIKKLDDLVNTANELEQAKKPKLSDIFKLALSKITTEDIISMGNELLTAKEKFEQELKRAMIEETGDKDGDVYEFLLNSNKAKTIIKKLQ